MSKVQLYKAAEKGNTATVGELAPKLTQADIDWRNPRWVSNAKSVHTKYLNLSILVSTKYLYPCKCLRTFLFMYMHTNMFIVLCLYYPYIYIYVHVYAVCMHKCISFHFIFELF